jgi:hypothetical protein
VDDAASNVPKWDGHAREVALLWRLAKRGKHAECRLWTNPQGAEIRVEAGGEFIRSEAARDAPALIDAAMTWKAPPRALVRIIRRSSNSKTARGVYLSQSVAHRPLNV